MFTRAHIISAAALSFALPCATFADAPADQALIGSPAAQSYWPSLLGEQYTFVLQHQTSLHSPYEGPLSLRPDGDTQPTKTIGFYFGWALRSWARRPSWRRTPWRCNRLTASLRPR